MASIVDRMEEISRRQRTGDDYYYKKLPWLFRIKCDSGQYIGPLGANGEALFPLPINPDRFDYSLPYAMELTPQQESGVISEESGFVIGEINMSGTTGFKMRKQQTLTESQNLGKFTGAMGENGGTLDYVSGQMAFWILAQRCFEGYSELKKDPEHGPNTRMELHIMKDQLHLEVKPRQFRVTRSAEKERVTYRYEIQLAVVGEAKSIDYKLPDDRDLFDKIGDTINEIRDAVQSVAATIDDLTAAMGELTRYVSGIASLVDDIRSINEAASNFVNGVKSFFDIPAQTMTRTIDLIESTAQLFEDVATLPSDVYQSLLKCSDEFCRMKVAARQYFTEAWDEVAADYEGQTQDGYGSDVNDNVQTDIDNKSTEGASAQGLMTIDAAFGGAVKPGDAKRQQFAQIQRRLSGRGYTGFAERVVGQGDTVQSLAAKHMNDPSRWMDIVVANRLVAPYITSGAKIPNTVTIGDKIIIPTTRATQPPDVFTTGAVEAGDSQAEEFLGTDFELVKDGTGWSWAVDLAHGATDGKKVKGFDCLGQGVASRLRTTKGENILNPNLGVPRIVGSNLIGDETIEASYWVRSQILADPRVDRVRNFGFEKVKDVLTLEMSVQPVGFNTSRTISRTIT